MERCRKEGQAEEGGSPRNDTKDLSQETWPVILGAAIIMFTFELFVYHSVQGLNSQEGEMCL